MSMRSEYTILWYGSSIYALDLEPKPGLLGNIESVLRWHVPLDPAREAGIVLSYMIRAVREAQPTTWKFRANDRWLRNCDLDILESSCHPDHEMEASSPDTALAFIEIYKIQHEALGLRSPEIKACAFRRKGVHDAPIRFLQNESLVDDFRMCKNSL